MGIVTSLIAAMLYAGIVYLLVREPVAQRTELQSIITELKNRQLQGLETIREKYEYDPPFWKALLSSSERRVDILGHALTTWCEEPYRGMFVGNLLRVARAGGRVRVVVMDPDSTLCGDLLDSTGTDYRRRVRETVDVLTNEVIAKLPGELRDSVQLRYCRRYPMTYMLVGTENQSVFSPYLARTPSRSCPLLVFSEHSRFHVLLRNDFDRVFSDAEPVTSVSAGCSAPRGHED